MKMNALQSPVSRKKDRHLPEGMSDKPRRTQPVPRLFARGR